MKKIFIITAISIISCSKEDGECTLLIGEYKKTNQSKEFIRTKLIQSKELPEDTVQKDTITYYLIEDDCIENGIPEWKKILVKD